MRGKAFFYSFKTRVTLVLILAMVSVMGLNNLFVYRFNLISQFEQLRHSLTIIAQTATMAVDAETLQKIPLTKEGVESPAYREVSAKLRKILEMNKPLQYSYILTKTTIPGKLQFWVDVEAIDRKVQRRKASAHPGEFYYASRFPEMLEGFTKPSARPKIANGFMGSDAFRLCPDQGQERKRDRDLGCGYSGG